MSNVTNLDDYRSDPEDEFDCPECWCFMAGHGPNGCEKHPWCSIPRSDFDEVIGPELEPLMDRLQQDLTLGVEDFEGAFNGSWRVSEVQITDTLLTIWATNDVQTFGLRQRR